MNTVQEPPGCPVFDLASNLSFDPASPLGSTRLNTPFDKSSRVPSTADVSLRQAGLRTSFKPRLREIR